MIVLYKPPKLSHNFFLQVEAPINPKEFVLQTVRQIVHSGELISPRTNQPLSAYEKAEYLARATFYFIFEERKWMSKKRDGCNDLAPVYDVIIMLLKMEEPYSETLKRTVDMICQTPTRDEGEYQEYLKELRYMLLPQGSEAFPNGLHEENLSELKLIKKVWGHVQENVWGYLSASGGSALGSAVISSAVDEMVMAFDGTMQSYNCFGSTLHRDGERTLFMRINCL